MCELREKILTANIEEHRKEAKYYDIIHTEIFNFYEQKRINKSLDAILNNFNKDCKILEIGCGTGNLTLKLLDRGFKNITCLDISKEMLEVLRKKMEKFGYDKNNVNLIVSDLDSFLSNNEQKFDIILMASVLHHLPDYINSLMRLKEVLNEDGLIYITHEPLPPQRQNLLVKFLLKVDYLLYAFRYIVLIVAGKLKYLKRDCHYSDYHTGENALDLTEIRKIFSRGYHIKISNYPNAKFGLTALLLGKLRYLNSFELLIKKLDSKTKIEEVF